jgi:hypothetical protein
MRKNRFLGVATAAAFLLGCGAAVDGGGEESAIASIGSHEEALVFFPAAEVELRYYSDLVLDGTVEFYDYSDTEQSVLLDVTNIGNFPAYYGAGRVNTGLDIRPATFASYAYGTAVNPGGKGYISARIPSRNARHCMSYTVQIDLDHTLQWDNFGNADIFQNDLARVEAPCFRWDAPITLERLGNHPDPMIENKSLSQIVGGRVIGTSVGRCSNCHYKNSGRRYSPNVAAGGRIAITKDEFISGRRWAGLGGWAEEFQKVGWKSGALKHAFKKWALYGAN